MASTLAAESKPNKGLCEELNVILRQAILLIVSAEALSRHVPGESVTRCLSQQNLVGRISLDLREARFKKPRNRIKELMIG
jgi:hypothetical protein